MGFQRILSRKFSFARLTLEIRRKFCLRSLVIFWSMVSAVVLPFRARSSKYFFAKRTIKNLTILYFLTLQIKFFHLIIFNFLSWFFGATFGCCHIRIIIIIIGVSILFNLRLIKERG